MDFTEHHLREITENSERSKSNTHRLDEVEEDIKSLLLPQLNLAKITQHI